MEEAFQAGHIPEYVFYSRQLSERGLALVKNFEDQKVEVFEIDPRLMETISETDAPQGILAVLPIQSAPLPEELDFVLILDRLRDPGNLGTIFRTAAAAGVQVVILTPGTTDGYAPKVVRSAMGAHFRLPILTMDWNEIRQMCQNNKPIALKKFLAESENGVSCWEINWKVPLALVIGGEAEGASPEARALVDQNVTIPMPGKTESLNAAVAASIFVFEVVRQRKL